MFQVESNPFVMYNSRWKSISIRQPAAFKILSILNIVCAFHVHPWCQTLVKIEFYFVDFCMERFDFYSDVVFVCLAYSCQWQWAHLTAGVLVVATLGQAAGAAYGDGHPCGMCGALLGFVPHAASPAYTRSGSPKEVIAGHALGTRAAGGFATGKHGGNAGGGWEG